MRGDLHVIGSDEASFFFELRAHSTENARRILIKCNAPNLAEQNVQSSVIALALSAVIGTVSELGNGDSAHANFFGMTSVDACNHVGISAIEVVHANVCIEHVVHVSRGRARAPQAAALPDTESPQLNQQVSGIEGSTLGVTARE